MGEGRDWHSFRERLQIFADSYCRKQPSLGMIADMCWVLDVEMDFHLVPKEQEPDPEPPPAMGERAK